MSNLIETEDHSFCIQIESCQVQVPGPTDALVTLSTSGVCGTNMAMAAANVSSGIVGYEGMGA